MAEYDGERFHNRTLELDGNVFRNCHFINCQFRFRGIAPFGFEGNRLEGTFWLHFLDDWQANDSLLTPLCDELRRYGYRLENALRSYAEYGHGAEFHGEWTFHRDGKAPYGGHRLGDPLEPRQDDDEVRSG
jgi:hypothetical protein